MKTPKGPAPMMTEAAPPAPPPEAPRQPLDTFGLELALSRLNELKRARVNPQDPEYLGLGETVARLIQAAGRVL